MSVVFTGTRMPDSGSLVGDILVLRQMEVGSEPYTIDSASVSIVGPTSTNTPTVSFGVSSSANQVLEALASESDGGRYQVVWTMQADGQTTMRSQSYFVTWTDVYTQVRALLLNDASVVSNYDIDLVLSQIMSSFLQQDVFAGQLASYSAVTDPDREQFDRALALMSAAFMRPFLPKQTPTGEVIRFTSGTDTYEWQPPLRKLGQTVEEMWVDAAWELLTGTVAFGTEIRSYQDAKVGMVATGRRRQQTAPLLIDSLGIATPNPAFTMWYGWLGLGGKLDWSWRGGGW